MKTKRTRLSPSAAPAIPRRPDTWPRLPAEDATPSFSTRHIETDHGKLEVRQSVGTGLAVLFLHGNSGAKEVFGDILNGPLSLSNRLIAIDLPGHGGSEDAPVPQESYTVPGYTDALCQIMEALDLEQVVLVGWSLGGHVALEAIARIPGVIGAFTMGTPPLHHDAGALAGAFRAHPALALLGQSELDDKQLELLAAAATNPVVAPHLVPAMRRADGRARVRLFESLLAGDFEDEMAILKRPYDVPVALVIGEDDPFVNVESARDVASPNLWGGRCHVIPAAGHAPFIDAPSIVHHLLAKFMSEMEVRAAHFQDNPPLALGG